MAITNPFKEAADAISEVGGQAFNSCFQCGLCSGVCPWNRVRNFMTQKLIHQAQFGLVNLEGEDAWLCATCGACVQRCPRKVEIIDVMKAIRRIGMEGGVTPKALKTTMTSISAVGNPWSEAREKRTEWAKGLDIKTYTEGTEWLYFPCCTPAYDPRAKRIALATVNILKKLGVDFGILASGEVCCGESARKAGEERLFTSSAQTNIDLFKANKVHKVITSSPHCYHTFKNEYPKLGSDFEVVHITQFLAKLIDEGKLKPTKELKKKVVYHDPCYLGRHNEIYDEPRMVFKSIPGLELIEFPESRQDSLCCGGGGGRIWMETKKEERLSTLRIEQAIEVGAEVLAVACPYCILNFDDGLLTIEKGDTIEIKDIVELVQGVI